MIRRFGLCAPFFAAGAVVFAFAQGCGDNAEDPPTQSSSVSKPSKTAADAKLHREVAYVAAAAARCSAPGAGRDCAQNAKADVASLKTRGYGVKPQAIDLSALPGKEIVCAVAKKVLEALKNGSSADAGAGGDGGGADASADASADAGAARDIIDVWGGRVALAGGGTTTAESAVVWDLTRSQSAAFIQADGGVGALTGLATGHRGAGQAEAANVVASFSGMFELDGAQSAHRVKKPDGRTAVTLSPAGLPGGLPAATPAFLASLATRTSYLPWDAATTALAGLPTGKVPSIAGGEGTKYVQYAADPDSDTSAGAQMAVAMLNQAGDTGDFTSSAGEGALTSIASGIASGLGIALDVFCGGDGAGDAGLEAGRTSCTGEPEGYCGSNVCGWNGGGFCCRPDPTGNEDCQIDDECVNLHGPTWFCGLKSKPVAQGESRSVCTQRAACSK